ncbi:MAG TPA: LOG family protein, partial [Acidimicrobiia bacterium]|nr:LOG family protein [Acidimicrobiia bacterium]
KIKHFPVVLFDSSYWGEMIEWIRNDLLSDGMISPDDIELLHMTDDVDEAVEQVLACYERRCADDPSAPHKEDAQ